MQLVEQARGVTLTKTSTESAVSTTQRGVGGPASTISEAFDQGDPAPAVTANNRFALALYTKLSQGGDKAENLFFSPLSLSTALAMTSAGAGGTTAKEMADVLKFSVPEGDIHKAYARLQRALLRDAGGCQLRIASRLWGQKDMSFLPPFLSTTRECYGAELGALDFAGQLEPSRQAINAWVAQQTEQKINDLLPPGILSPLTRLVLTNAIYFKGDWRQKFPREATQDGPFRLGDGSTVPVPLMTQKARFGYAAHESLQVLEMPYTEGSLSMVVLLPKSPDGLPALERQLTDENLARWTADLPSQSVRVFLPRMKLTAMFNLGSTLAAMGMPTAFDPGRADFSRMTAAGKLSISAVVHKAFVDVNEEGTEAAAATAVVGNLPSPPEPVFRADHPFLFLIRDAANGCILFLGRATNPAR